MTSKAKTTFTVEAAPRAPVPQPRAPHHLASASALLLATCAWTHPALAQQAICPEPEQAASSGGGSTVAQRLRDPDPLVREMARADQLADAGQRDQAAAIYNRLAQSRPDRRETARRANLRLAQLAISAKDFTGAEGYVRKAAAPGATADIQARARRMTATIAYRRQVADAEAGLESVNTLIAAGRTDEALQAGQALLQRQCPYPPDFPARVKTRIAQTYRMRGDFDQARAVAQDARASAATPTISQGATVLISEIETAALAARLRADIASANTRIAANDAPGAIALLEPIVNRPDAPADIAASARLRLARAYTIANRYDEATALLDPLVTSGALDAEDQATASRIYLARAEALNERRDYVASDAAYRRVLAWNTPLEPEVRDSARLGLARSLDRRGQRREALEQVRLVRADPATPRLAERAVQLLADIQNNIPLNRLVGYVEAGAAYDSNVPTRVSALDDNNDDDVALPVNQTFSDYHVSIAGRLQYHQQLGASENYLDLSLAASRTFQFDLTQLDRTRVDVRAGPSFAVGDGTTRFMLGGVFGIEWRGTRFRASEPGIYVGARTDIGANASLTGTYTLSWHNDYRDDRDGTDHSFDAVLRYDLADSDALRLNLRATREGANVDRFRDWRLLAAADWTHRFDNGTATVPYLDLGASAERVIYDGLTTSVTFPAGIARRDWKYRADAEAGVELMRNWRAGVHYSFYDIDSNIPERNRRPDHQVGVQLRYSWN